MKKQVFSVPDMSCGHCKAAIEKAVTADPAVTSVAVDLGAKTVSVESTLEAAAVAALIDGAGYTATLV